MTDNSKEDFRFDAEQEQVLDAVTAMIMAEERRPSVLNVARYRQMEFVYGALRRLVRDMDGVTLTYGLHQPFKSTGFISLEGESLEFYDSPWFARTVGLADNVEVYPLVSGRVRMTWTFHRLTIPIG